MFSAAGFCIGKVKFLRSSSGQETINFCLSIHPRFLRPRLVSYLDTGYLPYKDIHRSRLHPTVFIIAFLGEVIFTNL